jgi:hypothetical protein
MATKAAPSLADGRKALEERLTADIAATVRRHCGGAVVAKAGFTAELAGTARGYADALRSLALDGLASSVGELVTLARVHLGVEETAPKQAARRT